LQQAEPILLEKHIPGVRVRGGFADALYGDLIFETKKRLDEHSRGDGQEEIMLPPPSSAGALGSGGQTSSNSIARWSITGSYMIIQGILQFFLPREINHETEGLPERERASA
jgi:hypothetical protein